MVSGGAKRLFDCAQNQGERSRFSAHLRPRHPCYVARVSATLRLGQVLFRFRSFTPLPVLAVLAWLLWRARGPVTPLWLVALGLAVAVLGQALRFYVVSWVPEGTSGQD